MKFSLRIVMNSIIVYVLTAMIQALSFKEHFNLIVSFIIFPIILILCPLFIINYLMNKKMELSLLYNFISIDLSFLIVFLFYFIRIMLLEEKRSIYFTISAYDIFFYRNMIIALSFLSMVVIQSVYLVFRRMYGVK